jgi:hypothetical protein
MAGIYQLRGETFMLHPESQIKLGCAETTKSEYLIEKSKLTEEL